GAVAHHEAADPVGVDVTSATVRAQDAGPGALFAALPGARAHGASFADQAVELGASAVLTDPRGVGILTDAVRCVPVLVCDAPRAVLGEASAEIYGQPSRAIDLIGITGTSGKTTTTYF